MGRRRRHGAPDARALPHAELVKRTAVMLWQQSRRLPENRRPPITLAHMTNALLVPVMSFLNCNDGLGVEVRLRRLPGPFCRRPEPWPRRSAGRWGAWPTVLGGGQIQPKDPRADFCYRTRLGVALVHEIQVFDYSPKRDAQIYAKTVRAGLRHGRLPSVETTGTTTTRCGSKAANARTLALAGPKGAVIVATDYWLRRTSESAASTWHEAETFAASAGVPIWRPAPRSETRVEAGASFAVPMRKHDFRIPAPGV